MAETPPPSENVPDANRRVEGARRSEPVGSDEGTLERLLAEAQAKLCEQREAWLRALAEADNVRKRAQAEVSAAHKFAVERLVESLLPVADSLEAALGSGDAGHESLKDGVELTLKQLRAAFEKARVRDIIPAAGERFDPHRHHAVSAVESDAEPNTIVSVLQKGYRLHDRVVRPALVVVSQATSEPGPAKDPGAT